MSYRSIFKALAECEKVPRKAKKLMLGRRIPKSKLKRLLIDVKILYSPKTMWENVIATPYVCSVLSVGVQRNLEVEI